MNQALCLRDGLAMNRQTPIPALLAARSSTRSGRRWRAAPLSPRSCSLPGASPRSRSIVTSVARWASCSPGTAYRSSGRPTAHSGGRGSRPRSSRALRGLLEPAVQQLPREQTPIAAWLAERGTVAGAASHRERSTGTPGRRDFRPEDKPEEWRSFIQLPRGRVPPGGRHAPRADRALRSFEPLSARVGQGPGHGLLELRGRPGDPEPAPADAAPLVRADRAYQKRPPISMPKTTTKRSDSSGRSRPTQPRPGVTSPPTSSAGRCCARRRPDQVGISARREISCMPRRHSSPHC